MEGLGTLSAPELVIDDKTERGFVNWFKSLQQVGHQELMTLLETLHLCFSTESAEQPASRCIA